MIKGVKNIIDALASYEFGEGYSAFIRYRGGVERVEFGANFINGNMVIFSYVTKEQIEYCPVSCEEIKSIIVSSCMDNGIDFKKSKPYLGQWVSIDLGSAPKTWPKIDSGLGDVQSLLSELRDSLNQKQLMALVGGLMFIAGLAVSNLF